MRTKFWSKSLVALTARICGRFRQMLTNEDGASVIFIALTLPALIGSMGLAAEVSFWRLHQRSMQNAADAAAIAAAADAGSNYVAVAKSVAAQYGFVSGVGQVAVAVNNPATATGCTTNCYSVTITDQVPLFFSQVVGYQGSATANNQKMSTLTAGAVATGTTGYSYCIVALAGSGKTGISSNGASNANLNGCNTMSNTGASCKGHNLNAGVGNAHGTDNGCGNIQNSNVPTVSDAFSQLASNIPSNSCSSYPQEPVKKNDPLLPASNQWFGTYTTSGVQVVCGDQQLTADTTLSNTVLVIENGQLDTNGFTLHASNSTVVFSGTSGNSYQHIPTGGGTLDIAAPTSGSWSGVAMYQDPSLTQGVDISAAGSTPTWNISGLVYLPHASVTLSGAVSKAGTGQSCLELVVDNLSISGSGAIFANNTQCAAAGLNQSKGGNRGMLVN
jgi:Flp pilus assembly protein TadG